MTSLHKCPVCGKSLTQVEFDKALGLWKEKQAHIQHLEHQQKDLKDKERRMISNMREAKARMKKQEDAYKRQAKESEKRFKHEQSRLRSESKTQLANQAKKASQQLKDQQVKLEHAFQSRMKIEIKKGVDRGVEEKKKSFAKQEKALRQTQNKMKGLENSLKATVKKHEQANEEIKRLKEQIAKGTTPQIEGLLEENVLLAKLIELFPSDKFEHPGKGGDIIQHVLDHGKVIGIIVYECKKVKSFSKHHIEQAKEARRLRGADYAVLVTNAFPSKKQYYFVERTVFVISPVNLEPITYTLRDSLVRMALVKLSNEAKQKAVQRVYDYLSGPEYNNKINDVSIQLMDLGKDLKAEMKSHWDRWRNRYSIYSRIFSDVGQVDFHLKGLVQNRLEEKPKQLGTAKKEFVAIKELE